MGLPKRWLPYSKFGSQIPGTRFVAFKCPLRPTLCSSLPEDQQLTPSLLMQYIPSLKMIIDLTYTTKYYTPEEFKLAGLRHVKVMCQGHYLPDSRVIHKFYDEVDSFLQSEPEGLIGVHCTHGVNRTGFLICKYMIAKLGFQPQDAITAFGKARGHPIERTNYLSGLGVPNAELQGLVGRGPEDEDQPPQDIVIRGDRDHRSTNRQESWSAPRYRERYGAPSSTGHRERNGPDPPGPQHFQSRSPHYGQQQWGGPPPHQHYNQSHNNWRRDDRNVPHGSWQPRFDHQPRGGYRPPTRGRDDQRHWGGSMHQARDQGNRNNYISRRNSRDNLRQDYSRRDDSRRDDSRRDDSRRDDSMRDDSRRYDRQKEEGVQPAAPIPDLLEGIPPSDR